MTYIGLATVFVAIAAFGAVLLTALNRGQRAHLGAVALTGAALFVLTAVFDSLMIAVGLFHYAPDHLLGIHIGLAPLEDFTYPLAGILLLPALWALLRARRRARDAEAAQSKAEE